jgi:hypothetical protein
VNRAVCAAPKEKEPAESPPTEGPYPVNAAFLIQLVVCWLAASAGALVLVTLLLHGAAVGERRQRWARAANPEVAVPAQERPQVGLSASLAGPSR